ncbi:unnamed protein product [Hymenolepis diminuta]|uniref:Apple domain-containing protein n=1 Tax=Hymenolepis diminuta TaxID=6216 RepID=A0A0R3S8R6_HYMDI|nr:unnamed protein product [Hymenolepis diminuta]
MRCEATFLEKTIFKECYVTDRSINLMSQDIYSPTYECEKSCERMQPVSTFCLILLRLIDYSAEMSRRVGTIRPHS